MASATARPARSISVMPGVPDAIVSRSASPISEGVRTSCKLWPSFVVHRLHIFSSCCPIRGHPNCSQLDYSMRKQANTLELNLFFFTAQAGMGTATAPLLHPRKLGKNPLARRKAFAADRQTRERHEKNRGHYKAVQA